MPPARRVTISLTNSQWEAVMDYRHRERITTVSQAIREIIDAGLRAIEQENDDV